MRKVRPVVAKTPEALAGVLGLSAAEAKEWQVQYALLQRLKEIVRKEKITPCEPRKASGHFANKIDGDSERQGRRCFK